jgi:hypothetical protein
MRAVRRDVQLVFQDPYSSLHPRMTVRELVTEPWKIHPDVVPAARRETELGELLEMVGLRPEHAQILNLLRDLQSTLGLSYLGEIVEIGDREEIWDGASGRVPCRPAAGDPRFPGTTALACGATFRRVTTSVHRAVASRS